MSSGLAAPTPRDLVQEGCASSLRNAVIVLVVEALVALVLCLDTCAAGRPTPGVAWAVLGVAIAWEVLLIVARLRASRRYRHRAQKGLLAQLAQAPVTEPGGLVICCSGGGVKSAAFCLGALQRLDESGIYRRARTLVGVSGGGYAAAAFSLIEAAPGERVLPMDSPALRRIRGRTNYIADRFRTKVVFVGSLLFGLLVNVVVLMAGGFVFAAALASWAVASGRLATVGQRCHADLGCAIGSGAGLWATVGVPAILLLGALIMLLRQRFSRVGWTSRARLATNDGLRRLTDLGLGVGRPSDAPGGASTALTGLAVAWLVLVPGVLVLAVWWAAGHPLHLGPLSGLGPMAKAVLGTAGGVALLGSLARAGVRRAPREGFWGAVWDAIRRRIVPRAILALLCLVALLGLGSLVALLASGRGPSERTTWVWLPIAGAVLAAARLGGSANGTSLHAFYRDRLAWAYLDPPRPGDDCRDDATGAGDREGVAAYTHVGFDALGEDRVDRDRPRLVLCAMANLRDPQVTPSGRSGAPFIMSASAVGLTDAGLPCGEQLLPLADYVTRAGDARQPLTLAAALAISAAAISPVAGRESRVVGSYRILFALCNIRLGVWLPNPYWLRRGALGTGWQGPAIAARPTVLGVLREAIGSPGIHEPYLYLTDGGHYDNTGLVEALRRRPDRVIVIDGSGDPEGQFTALGKAIATARMDLGVEVELDPRPLVRAPGEAYVRWPLVRGRARWPADASGPAHECEVIFLKGVMPEGMPWDLETYRFTNPTFPATSDKLEVYDEFDFESYRKLGHTLAGWLPEEPAEQPAKA